MAVAAGAAIITIKSTQSGRVEPAACSTMCSNAGGGNLTCSSAGPYCGVCLATNVCGTTLRPARTTP
jgi:hypothetical protein